MARFGWGTNPLEEFERLRRRMHRLLSSVSPSASRTDGYPPANVSVTDKDIIVRCELPGVDPEEIQLTLSGKTLAISGQRTAPETVKDARTHRSERPFGSFARVISLPEVPDAEGQLDAVCRHGILTVICPRTIQEEPRRIHVNA